MPSTSSRAFAGQPRFPLSPVELQRWIRFSAKGGVGKAKAKVDRVSESEDQLMMLEGDEIVVLMNMGDDTYLVRSLPQTNREGCGLIILFIFHRFAQGHCEDVVGLFHGQDVQFLQAKLKRPVMTPRSSSTSDHSKFTSNPSNVEIPSPPPPLSEPIPPPSTDGSNGKARDLESDGIDRRIWQAPAVSGAVSGLGRSAEQESVAGLDLRSRRRVGVEGIGIEVRLDERSSKTHSDNSFGRTPDAMDSINSGKLMLR